MQTAIVSSEYYINYLSIRETVLNTGWLFDGLPSVMYAREKILSTISLEVSIKNYFHLNTQAIKMCYTNFLDYLDNFYDESLCETGRNSYFKNYTSCASFMYGIADDVLYQYDSREFMHGLLSFPK